MKEQERLRLEKELAEKAAKEVYSINTVLARHCCLLLVIITMVCVYLVYQVCH